jgi:hypothetical protein
MTRVSSPSLNYEQPSREVNPNSAQMVDLLKKLKSFDPVLHGGEAFMDEPIGYELSHLFKSPSI